MPSVDLEGSQFSLHFFIFENFEQLLYCKTYCKVCGNKPEEYQNDLDWVVRVQSPFASPLANRRQSSRKCRMPICPGAVPLAASAAA